MRPKSRTVIVVAVGRKDHNRLWNGGDEIDLMKVIALEKTMMTVAELAELAKEGPVGFTWAGHPVVAVKDLSGSDLESVGCFRIRSSWP